jgi:hypothetical protein
MRSSTWLDLRASEISELVPDCCVGGAVQHTVVTRGGIDSAIIHSWPDRVSQPIRET